MTSLTRRRRLCARLGWALAMSDPFVRALARLPGRGAVVLRYHSVNDDPVWGRECVQRSLVVPSAVFDAQVAHLVQRHRVVGIGEIARAMREGRDLDRLTVAITFDDGYEDNYRKAFPILKRHGTTAAFYVTTGSVGDAKPLWTVALRRAVMRARAPALDLSFRPGGPLDVSSDDAREKAVRELTGRVKRCAAPEARAAIAEVLGAAGAAGGPGHRVMMNWDEIREMHGAGMTIGAHTVEHLNLPSLSDADLEREVHGSRNAIAAALDARVEHFAYPNGRTDRHCDARVAGVVAAAGFVSAVTSVAGPASRRFSAHGIPRFGVYARHDDVARLAVDIHFARMSLPSDKCIAEIAAAMKSGRGAKQGVKPGGAA
jgi:peptidoglycan/xylan/chitin deacetylase (PgdA/CDA1 family)